MNGVEKAILLYFVLLLLSFIRDGADEPPMQYRADTLAPCSIYAYHNPRCDTGE